MKLDPRERKNWQGFLDLLSPPPGYRTAGAIGSSFGLSFDALTAALLAMCDADGEALAENPVAAAMAVTRLRHKVRILVHPGTISGPAKDGARKFVAMLDRLILEVDQRSGLFHPKVWALKFERLQPTGTGPQQIGRIVVCSRNLSQSTSFELSATFEGGPASGDENRSQFCRDAASALRGWLGKVKPSHSPLPPVVAAMPQFVQSLALDVPREAADTLRLRSQEDGRRLGSVLPLDVSRVLVVSPFLQPEFIDKMLSLTNRLQIVSTPETLNELDDNAFTRLETLGQQQRSPSLYYVTDVGDPEGGYLDGVHAKLVLIETARGEAVTLLGSANATGPGWGLGTTPNVEAMAEMRPGIPIDRFAEAFIRENKTKVHPWIVEYDRASRSDANPAREAERRLLAALRDAAKLDLWVDYSEDAQVLRVGVGARRGRLHSDAAGSSDFEFDFAPLLLTDRGDAWQPLESLAAGDCRFEAVPVDRLTAFVVIRCRSQRFGMTSSRIVLARLKVASGLMDRRDDVVREDIMSTADPLAVLRALVRGLGYLPSDSERSQATSGGRSATMQALLEDTNLERLLQAIAMQPELVTEMRLLLGSAVGSPFQQLCDQLETALKNVALEANA